MKKLLLILFSCILITGCSKKAESVLEIIPESTTEVVTEITDLGIFEKQTYREVLEDIYYNCKFPDWDYKNYTIDVSIDFAVYDVDSDGKDELLVTFDNRSIYVYDHNSDGNLVEQFSGDIRSDFYENGSVKVYSAHNQTHSLEVHPFELYKYNIKTDAYDKCGRVYGIDKNIVDMINKEKEKVGTTDFLDYPAEYDTSGSGTVYYISTDGETDIPSDVTKYNEYYEQFTNGTEIIDVPFMKLTEENIKKVSGNKYDTAENKEHSKEISISRAYELLWNSLEKYGGRRIVYQDRQKFDDKPYYIFRSFEDYDDRRVTTSYYAVDIITGECYNTNGLTELTPLINEEKKFSCKVTELGGVEVYSDGKFYQSLDVKIDDVILHRQSKNLMFMDYNFDGYNDIAVDTGFATNRVCSYFRYNPDTEYFEKWEELDNLHFYIHVNEEKNLYVHSKSGAVDTDDTVYKWLGDVLTPVSREKRYSKGKDIIKDYFEYDSKGNEILAKREKYIFDENGKITDTVNVPLP